jgi:hypothetical protein
VKKVTALLVGGIPLEFRVSPPEVAAFRACVIDRLVFPYEDTAIACRHVMAYTIEDVPAEPDEEKLEDGCNS